MVHLLLIESPGKIAKLKQILGNGWIVKASMGHVRELADDGEDALGFDLSENSVQCRYVPRGTKGKQVLADLRQVVKQADRVFLGCDEDREGEVISWHLAQELRLKNPQRVVYHEITADAVRAAIAQPRPLNANLIAAGRARDCLDKLVGYRGSKYVVWKLNIGAKSMGRVQSATLHLLCQREREIQVFQPQDYWSVWVDYQEGFRAFYRVKLNAAAPSTRSPRNAAASSPSSEDAPTDIADDTGETKESPTSDRVLSQAEADRLVEIARTQPHTVKVVEGKIAHQAPPPPFITSTLQQAAGAKLHLSPDRTMQVAQSLYEKGLITYMRTDSVALSPEFCQAVRGWLEAHDPDNLPKQMTRHKSRKGSQEAHEAIRPTDLHRPSAQLKIELSADDFALYVLIWKRAVASQCNSARLRKTRVVTQSGNLYWETRGQMVEFLGYARYWHNLQTDAQLPALSQGQALTLQQAQAEPKQTQPPPRYSEPKLVQLMERRGIGRPSTYAPTIKTLKQRDYVQGVKGKLQPTALGLDLDAALEKLLMKLVDPTFTAEMEQSLDQIAQGELNWERWLNEWNRGYFAPALEQARQQMLGLGYAASRSTAVQPESHTSQEAPLPQRQPTSGKLTEHPCPVCHKPMEEYAYQKDGQHKTLLRCSDRAARQDGQHQEAVYFYTAKGSFWSPKFGELAAAQPVGSAGAVQSGDRQPAKKSRKRKKP
ncbi:MAG TPA: type I DNA topoisomerase [Coleofasciculaceae cyanobacterium]|jgi:DNA topoisomerase-1